MSLLPVRRAPVLTRYVIALCSDGSAAHAELNRLANGLLKGARANALLLPVLVQLEEQAALRQAEFQVEAAQPGATATSIVSAVLAEAAVVAGGSIGSSSAGATTGAAQAAQGAQDVQRASSPLSDKAISDALMGAGFRNLVVAASTLDTTTEIGRRGVLEAAFSSGCAIVIRVLLLGEKTLARRHPMFGVLFNLRCYLPHYFGYCQAVDTGTTMVPKRAESWIWAMPDGTDLKRLEKFCSLTGTAHIEWLAGASGALALHSLMKGGGKSSFREMHPLDYFCNKETVDLFSNFVHRTFVAAGAPAMISQPATGFTIASWFDFYKEYLSEAFTLASVKEQVQWLYYGHVRVISFLNCAENELSMFVNSMTPATATIPSLAPLDFQGAKDMREKISKLAEMREHREHFAWMRPDGPSTPMDAHVLPLLSRNLHLLDAQDQVAAKAVKGPAAQWVDDATPAGPLSKKRKKSAGKDKLVSATGAVGSGNMQTPGSQQTSALWLTGTLLLVVSWVWNIPKIAADWNIGVASRCWATILNAKVGANKLALCPNHAQHNDMSHAAHALLKDFNPMDKPTRAKYGRAPTREEFERLKAQKESGQMVPKPYVSSSPQRAPGAGRGRGRGGRSGRAAPRGGALLFESNDEAPQAPPELDDAALLEITDAAEGDLRDIIPGYELEQAQRNSERAVTFLEGDPADINTSEATVQTSVVQPAPRGGARDGRAAKAPKAQPPRHLSLNMLVLDPKILRPSFDRGLDLQEARLPASQLTPEKYISWAMQPFARAMSGFGFGVRDCGGAGRCGVNTLGRGLACLGFGDASQTDVELGRALRAELIEHSCRDDVLEAKITATSGASVGDSPNFAGAICSSLAGWLTAEKMVQYNVRDWSVETWRDLMSRDTTYVDTALLLLAADKKRVMIVCDMIDDFGKRIPGDVHVLLPREGIPPRGVVRLLCHTDTHFALIAQFGEPATLTQFLQEPAHPTPPPPPAPSTHPCDGKDVMFWELLSEPQRSAATALGYGARTWDLGDTPAECRLFWEEMSQPLLVYASMLGYTQESWDEEWASVMHYYPFSTSLGLDRMPSNDEANSVGSLTPCALPEEDERPDLLSAPDEPADITSSTEDLDKTCAEAKREWERARRRAEEAAPMLKSHDWLTASAAKSLVISTPPVIAPLGGADDFTTSDDDFRWRGVSPQE